MSRLQLLAVLADKFAVLACRLIGDIDEYVAQHVSNEGTATAFSYDADLQLTSCTFPCSWTKGAAMQFEAPGVQLEDARVASQTPDDAAPGRHAGPLSWKDCCISPHTSCLMSYCV